MKLQASLLNLLIVKNVKFEMVIMKSKNTLNSKISSEISTGGTFDLRKVTSLFELVFLPSSKFSGEFVQITDYYCVTLQNY